MTSSNNMVYVLQGNQLSAFYLDFGSGGPFDALKLLGDEKAQAEVRKAAKLRMLLSQDLGRVRAETKPAR